MARDWASLQYLFLQATGGTPRALHESWSHLSEAYRLLAAEIDVPELAAIDETVTVTAGNDYVDVSGIDYTVYAILDVFNKTAGTPMFPEPSGMTGRRLYLETTGKPAEGTLTHYQRDGSRLYVRGTAAVNTTLMVRVQRQMPDISAADSASAPLTPQQYDRALVHKAAELYYLLHPDENSVSQGERSFQQSTKHRDAFDSLAARPKSPRVEEAAARVSRFRLDGFRLTPRSRRR